MRMRMMFGTMAAVVSLLGVGTIAAPPALAQCLDHYTVSGVTRVADSYSRASSTEGRYPLVVKLDKASTHTNTWSATLSVSKSVVDAALGYNTTDQDTTTTGSSLATKDLGAGTYVVYADNLWANYTFKVKHTNAVCNISNGTGKSKKWVRYHYDWYKK